mgnify:CR=1 FL=1
MTDGLSRVTAEKCKLVMPTVWAIQGTELPIFYT